MDIFWTMIFIIVFIIFMVFVFSLGFLKPFLKKKEIFLIFITAFIVGSLGGAFFLTPVYDDLPEIVSTVEQKFLTGSETVYLDVSYSTNPDVLVSDLNNQEGVESVKVTGVTIYVSQLTDVEYKTIYHALGVLDSSYESYNLTKSGIININLTDNSSVSGALRSFSDWYELVYGGKVGSAQVHYEVTVASSNVDDFKEYLLSRDIVPMNVTGSNHHFSEYLQQHKLSNIQFVICCGAVGVFISILGIYSDKILVAFSGIKSGNKKKKNKYKKRK